jgi:putative Mn2+ efflux pump MntP
MSRIISYILILTGALVAIYAQANEEQNQYVLIGGIVVLMLGIYRISRNITSKNNQEEDHQNNTNS